MKLMFRLLHLFRPYSGLILVSLLVSLVTLLANVILMAISGWFIASMAIAGIAGITINYFTPAAIIRACAITRTLGRYAERMITHEVTFRILSGLRVWFYEQIEPLAPAGLGKYHSGDLLSRIKSDIDLLDEFYLKIFFPVIIALVSAILFILFMAFYHPVLALIEGGLLLLAGFILPYMVARLGYQTGQNMVTRSAELRTTLVDGFQGMGELLIYGSQEKQLQRIHDLSDELADEQEKMSRLSGLSIAGVGLSANLALWLVLLTAIPQVNQGQIPPAELAMLALFTLASFEAVQSLPLAFQTLGQTIAAAKRVFSIVDNKELASTSKSQEKLQTAIRQYGIEFENINFRYTAQDDLVLQAITFSLPEQKKLAVIGASGAGKSSLINLLLNFWTPEQGRISIAAQSYSDFLSESIQQQFSVVAQNPFLFNTSIRQNLLLAKPDASQSEIEEVCRISQIDDFIQSLESGYDTICGETGAKLSGGQIKRIAIARALLKPAPILILDEPGEGLDPLLANQVLAAIYQSSKTRSIVLITHNLRGLEQMDEILVMDQGKIIDRGNYQQLATESDAFKALQDLLSDFNHIQAE